jgi:hypothetical protein
MREVVKGCCKRIKEYALERYRQQMLSCVSKMPVARWHRLWKIGSPAIGTFRKDLKYSGIPSMFERLLIGEYPHTVDNILVTLAICNINDSQLDIWNAELKSLTQEADSTRQQEYALIFNGVLIRKYRTYEEPR